MQTKTLMIALSIALSTAFSGTTASAANRFISCKSEADKTLAITVELDGNSLVETRLGGKDGEVMWTFTDTSISEAARTVLLNDKTNFSKSMVLKAAAKESIDTATLIVSANSEGSIYDQLEYVADDGSGYVLLEYKNKKGETTNGAIFAGWGGFFNTCKTVN
ncbi:MAG: hypothetical protein H7336_10305 [Bacteriovorax sp.]|nr:hypothetical protein [Bacteriovorax sp.]